MLVFLSTLCEHLRRGQALALATVIHQEGSAPRGAGSRMLAHAGGLVAGTVGGGIVEAQTLEACTRSLAEKQGRVLYFDLSGAMAAQAEMICGGRVQVLVEVVLPHEWDFWEKVLACLHKEGGALLVPLEGGIPGSRTLLADGACYGILPLAPLPPHVYTLKEAAVLHLGDQAYFFQPLLPPLRLVLAGGGHVSRPTAHIAALAGYEVLVLDDRPEFAAAQRFPEAHTQLAEAGFVRCFERLPFVPGARTGIVIVTRGHVYDAEVLAQALATKASYIGMIGSRRKRDSLYRTLREQGLTEADLARVHCPVGLPIQAETPEEIAVSIVAECIQHFAAHGSA
ncbi:MAG: XdhC family protein [Desulfovibrionaceae bacterium]